VTEPQRPDGRLSAYRHRDERVAAAAWRFDLALGMALAITLSLAMLLVLAFADRSRPSGTLLLAWLALLSAAAATVAGGIALKVAGRIGGATLLLGMLAGPAMVFGLSVSPFALLGTFSALTQPDAFRAWAGPGYAEKRAQWGYAVGAVGALVPVALAARRLGRTALWDGLAAGAAVMVLIVLFGIGGGFMVRPQA